MTFYQDTYGPRSEKTWSLGFANNKGTDQPAHHCRLNSAFDSRFLESIKSIIATLWIFFILASLCSWGDLFESRFVRNTEDRFWRNGAHIIQTCQKHCHQGCPYVCLSARNCMDIWSLVTANSKISVRIFFSRITLKDIFATLKIRNLCMMYLYQ